jgi:hypothetical protein
MLETACQDFETLQDIIRGSVQVVVPSEAHWLRNNGGFAARARIDMVLLAARARINMALAKSFLFHARQANRICERNKATIALDRLERHRFLNATKPLTPLRNVNLHGFDGDGPEPSMHRHPFGIVDEMGLAIVGPEQGSWDRLTFVTYISP